MQEKTKAVLRHSSSRYFAVGITAFLIDYATLLILYYLLNVNLKVATATGFIVGFVISFAINRQWVFSSSNHKKRIHRQIAEYVILLTFNFFFTIWGVSFLNDHGIRPGIGKLIIMALIMCWNYCLFRWVIFVGASD